MRLLLLSFLIVKSMLSNNYEIVRPIWYVVFTEAKYDHWIFNFVDRSMGHVYAVQSLNDYQWLVVQPRANITQTKIMLKCQ